MPPSFDFQRFLNIRGAYGPTFLPAGRMAFITNITGIPQVWTVAAPGGWPVQVTFGAERVLYAHAAHAGGRMILGSDSGGDEHVQLTLLSADGVTRTPLDPNPAVIHTFGGWAPDDGALPMPPTRATPPFSTFTLWRSLRRMPRPVSSISKTAPTVSPPGRPTGRP